ncbi:Ig heavy chain Mem5-like [Chelmon rostratus]|uniref:Ig heavy chain Mem5-like n=1 Tax=Chelmon rostratus TaxID=109905 RepID=UPI001BE789E3|nr:Ig heavy chain Mem5-like [Chelmon rostratus]
MTLTTCVMFLMLSLISGVCSQTLTESEPVVKQNGESHRLTCTYAGISDDDTHISWIRRPEGRGLVWLARISANGNTRSYSRSVQSRFTISRDNNLDQVYLQMNSLMPEDSAVYYCTRTWVGGYAFQHWGHGTEVTVSSEPAVSPTLFPLVQCTPGPDDKISVGCLARDFFPGSLTFQWTDASGTSLTSVQYPPAEKNNKYTEVSLVQVSKSDWDSGKSFDCSVTHPGGPNSVKLRKSLSDGRKPKVTVHVLPEEVINQEDSAEVTLVCLVSSPVLQDYYIAWSEYTGKKTGLYMDGINSPPQKTKHGYSVTSVYTTTKEKWSSFKFECNVRPAGSNDTMTLREVSKAQGNATECKK